MKRVIYKYQIPAIPGRHKIKFATISDIVAVQPQGEFITLWATVRPDLLGIKTVGEELTKTFQVVMTGEEFEEVENGVRFYLGTCQFHGGSWVLHVFRIIEP